MLPRPYRLPRPQFPLIIKTGLRKHNQFFTIVYASAPKNITSSRFGIIVSTKVTKSAVKRNLIKRRLRYAVMSAISGLKPPIDVIIIAKPTSLGQSTKSFVTELSRLFSSSLMDLDASR